VFVPTGVRFCLSKESTAASAGIGPQRVSARSRNPSIARAIRGPKGREESFMVVDVCETLGVRNADQVPGGMFYDAARAMGLPVGWFLYNAVTFLATRNQAP
jgi:hypothetical protein